MKHLRDDPYYEGVDDATRTDDLPPILRRADPLDAVVRRYLLTGDERAMEELVRQTRSRLIAATRRIGRPQDAEDAVQGAYLSLVRRRGSELGAPVFPWLLTAAVRIAYRRKALLASEDRLAALLAREMPTAASPLSDLVRAEEAARFRDDLGRLPARYRDPIVLHYFQGLSTSEIALLLHVTDAAVRTRLHRARALLRAGWLVRPLLGVLAIPWFVADLGRSSSSHAIAAGVVMTKGTLTGVVLAAALAGALVAWGVARSAAPDSDAGAKATEPLVAEIARLRRDTADARARAETDRRRAESAERAMRDLNAEVREAADVERISAAAPRAEVSDPALRSAVKPHARYAFPEYDAVLRDLDWSSIGGNLAAMVPLVHRLGETSAKGDAPDMDLVGQLQRHLGELNSTASKVVAKIPGSGAYGTFTHPAFMTNAIAATLDAAKLPLTDEQSKALEAVGRDYDARDVARLSGYDERTWELAKEIDEGALKDGFFDQAFALLSVAQRDALSSPQTRGYVGIDAFSSGMMWSQFLQPIAFTDRENLVEQVLGRLASRLAASEDQKPSLRSIVVAWVDALPREWLKDAPHRVFGQPIVRVPVVTDAARQNLDLLRRAASALGSPDVADRAMKCGLVLVPLLDTP